MNASSSSSCSPPSGVGPKLAQAALAVLSPDELATGYCVREPGPTVQGARGGRKGAQRIVIELKDKINTVAMAEPSAGPTPEGSAWREQVASGLQGLGWSAKDAEAACAEVEYLAREDPQLNVACLDEGRLAGLARK